MDTPPKHMTEAFLANLLRVVVEAGPDGIAPPFTNARLAAASLSRRGLVFYRRDPLPGTNRRGTPNHVLRIVATEKGRARHAGAAPAPAEAA